MRLLFVSKKRQIVITSAALAIALVMILIGRDVGRGEILPQLYEQVAYNENLWAQYEKLGDEYDEIRGEYEKLGDEYDKIRGEYESMLAAQSEEAISVDYKYSTQFPTYDIAAIAVSLGKGETLGVRMGIWKAQKRELILPQVIGSMLFYVYDQNYKRIIDAGRIVGVYEFAFTAELTGEYTLVFDDRDGDCIVIMEHNSPEAFRDVSE